MLPLSHFPNARGVVTREKQAGETPALPGGTARPAYGVRSPCYRFPIFPSACGVVTRAVPLEPRPYESGRRSAALHTFPTRPPGGVTLGGAVLFLRPYRLPLTRLP